MRLGESDVSLANARRSNIEARFDEGEAPLVETVKMKPIKKTIAIETN